MSGTGAHRVRVVGRVATNVRPRRGRHRLGTAGLCHCRELRGVRVRLATRRGTSHAAPVSRARISADVAVLLLVAVIAGTVLVSGWYAAAGAAVIAGMVAH
jgi:hypothetical protein